MSEQVTATYTGRRDAYEVTHDGVAYRLPRGRATQVPQQVAQRLRGRANVTVHEPAKKATKKASAPVAPATNENEEASGER